MRIKLLPPNPSLDHLKRQAKQLLAGLRESQPDATLSDAQRLLAGEYGFRTWPDLKAEVDRRLAIGERGDAVADARLGAPLAAAFGLGDLVEPATVVSYEFQGPLLRLVTASGAWMAHEVFDWVDDAQVERTIPLMDAARGAGVASPVPRRTASGGWVATVDDRSWRVDEWLDRGPAMMKPAPTSSVRAVGRLLATLHGLRLVQPGPMEGWLIARRTAEQWQQILTIARDEGASWAPLLEQAMPAIVETSAIAPEPPVGEPLLLAHCDLVIDTLRIGPDRSLVVFDWDFSGKTPASWDLGFTLNAWAVNHDGTIDARAAAALVDGYAEVAGERPKVDLDFFGSAISANFNQLVSRMTASLRSEDEDEDERGRAAIEVTELLRAPMDIARLEALAAATRRE